MQTAPPPVPTRPSRSTHKVRIGQKYLLVAILLNVAAAILSALPRSQNAAPLVGLAILLLCMTMVVLGVVGVLSIGAGLRYGPAMRVMFALLMMVPLFNLLVLLFLNAKATATLRKAGYKVGFFGAKSSRA